VAGFVCDNIKPVIIKSGMGFEASVLDCVNKFREVWVWVIFEEPSARHPTEIVNANCMFGGYIK